MTTTAEAPTAADVRAAAGRNGSPLRWRHVMDLAINGRGEVTGAARGRWAAWGAVTQHLQQTEILAAGTTRRHSHAAGIYAFTTTRWKALSPTQIHSEGSPGGCDADDDNHP